MKSKIGGKALIEWALINDLRKNITFIHGFNDMLLDFNEYSMTKLQIDIILLYQNRMILMTMC